MRKRDYADGKKRMVRTLLSMGYTMKMDVPTHEQHGLPRWQVCMHNVNQWFLTSKHSPLDLRKEITAMTYNELTKAVTVFGQVKSNYLKKTYQ